MGDVYRANDPRLGRDIAVKTLTNTERGDGQAIERFLQEARMTASLDHPNIVKVFDVGMSNGRPYLVTELLDGETLRVPIGRGPVSEEEVRRIACAVTGGLAAAHACGLVDRDLKPENIFVTRSGTARDPGFRHREARAGSRAATRPRDTHGRDPRHGGTSHPSR